MHGSMHPRHVPWMLLVLFLMTAPATGQEWIISGTVTDRLGNGIEGIDFDIMDGDGTALSLSDDLTEEDGDFAVIIIEEVPTGFYTIELNVPEGSVFDDLLLESQFLAGDTELGDLVLTATITISGTVVDEDGDGIEGIDLQFYDENGELFEINNGDTGLDGSFAAESDVGTFDVEFRELGTEDYAGMIVEGLVVDQDIDLGTIVLRDGQVLTGLVETEDGEALADADIEVFDATTGKQIHTTDDDTNVDGEFRVIVPIGDLIVYARPPRGTLSVPASVEVTIASGDNEADTIVVPDGVELSGTIADADGTGIPDVDITVFDASTGDRVVTVHDQTDADGIFSFAVPEGTFDLGLNPPYPSGFAPRLELDVEVSSSGEDTGELTLAEGFSLHGVATSEDATIADVTVNLVDADTDADVYVSGNLTDVIGRYRIRVIEGTYDVTFTAPEDLELSSVTEADLELSADTNLDVDFVGSGDATAPVTDVACTVSDDLVELSWTNGETDYDEIEVYRDDDLLDTLTGSSTTYDDVTTSDGDYVYEIVGVRGSVSSTGVTCDATVAYPTPAIEGLTCDETDGDVELSWTLGAVDYDAIEIRKDDTLLETLDGDVTSTSDLGLTSGTYDYDVVPVRAEREAAAESCTVVVASDGEPLFLRGDVSGNGVVSALLDALSLLNWFFASGDEPPCMEAADVNGDDSVSALIDSLYLLNWQFNGGDAPPDPGASVCGPDPDNDTPDCETPPDC